jgi:hypothetical protein
MKPGAETAGVTPALGPLPELPEYRVVRFAALVWLVMVLHPPRLTPEAQAESRGMRAQGIIANTLIDNANPRRGIRVGNSRNELILDME